ncbi:MAG: hypothetical protein JW981_02445, partial [Anaerolineae bacterium]|nr:hypothetical protein [Anaerolineae bacterium]
KVDSPENAGVCMPQDADAVQGLGISRVALGLHCYPGVPIGSTGLMITGVRGEIRFNHGVEMISLGMTLEYGAPSILSIDSDITIYPSPFALKATADASLLNIITAAATVEASKNGVGATMEIDFLILHGSSALWGGKYHGKYYLNGSSALDVGVEKGDIYKKCWFSIFGKKLCTVIPPWDVTVAKVQTDFGLFTNNHYGYKGSVRVFGHDASMVVDITAKKFTFKGGKYHLVTPDDIRRARNTFDAVKLGTLSPERLDQHIIFESENMVRVNTTLPPAYTATSIATVLTDPAASDSGTQLADDVIQSTVSGNVVFILSQLSDGELEMELIAPDGTRYTPYNCPSSIEYTQGVVTDTMYIMYAVRYANSGQWQARILGDTENTDFLYAVVGNPPDARITYTRIEPTGTNSAQAYWYSYVHSGITQTNLVDIFATPGPLTRTLSYTDTNGNPVSKVVPVYEGYPIATDVDTNLSGYKSMALDLSHLPSDTYYFWIKLDDGETTPAKLYLTKTGYGDPMTITLDHSASFTTSWTTTITPLIDSRAGDVWLTWSPAPHPDVETYTLALESTSPLTTSLAITRETEFIASYGTTPTALLDNLDPGTLYTLTIAADAGLGTLSWTPPYTFVMPQPDFIISTTQKVTVAAGNQVIVPLELIIAEDLPYSIAFDIDAAATPDGFDITISPEQVTTPGETTAYAKLSPLPTMYTGDYAVPIVARSGNLKREVWLHVVVTPFEANTYLPVVMRQGQ